MWQDYEVIIYQNIDSVNKAFYFIFQDFHIFFFDVFFFLKANSLVQWEEVILAILYLRQ